MVLGRHNWRGLLVAFVQTTSWKRSTWCRWRHAAGAVTSMWIRRLRQDVRCSFFRRPSPCRRRWRPCTTTATHDVDRRRPRDLPRRAFRSLSPPNTSKGRTSSPSHLHPPWGQISGRHYELFCHFWISWQLSKKCTKHSTSVPFTATSYEGLITWKPQS